MDILPCVAAKATVDFDGGAGSAHGNRGGETEVNPHAAGDDDDVDRVKGLDLEGRRGQLADILNLGDGDIRPLVGVEATDDLDGRTGALLGKRGGLAHKDGFSPRHISSTRFATKHKCIPPES